MPYCHRLRKIVTNKSHNFKATFYQCAVTARVITLSHGYSLNPKIQKDEPKLLVNFVVCCRNAGSGNLENLALTLKMKIKFYKFFRLLQSQQAATGPATTVNPETEAQKFQAIANSILEMRIIKAELPDDLQTVALELVADTQTGLANCQATLQTNHIIWQYKLCAVQQLKMANLALTNLETEAVNRAAAAAETVQKTVYETLLATHNLQNQDENII